MKTMLMFGLILDWRLECSHRRCRRRAFQDLWYLWQFGVRGKIEVAKMWDECLALEKEFQEEMNGVS